MHHQLLQLITQTVAISGREKDLVRQYFDQVLCSKNSILEESGRIPKFLYFVESGFVRLFHYSNKGEEVTTHINCPPGFITSYSNFISQSVSDENLECVTDCVLLRIAKADLDLLMRESPGFMDFSILVFQQSLAYNEKRSKDLAALTAEQRYLKLIDERPEVLHNVPMQHIASFLGMNPKSLSRIRRHIIR